MYKKTKSEKWKDLYIENANFLFSKWEFSEETQSWVWIQHLYGEIRPITGAGHGFCGNIYPLLLGFELLSEQQQKDLLERSVDTIDKGAVWDGASCNWKKTLNNNEETFLVQWCHGAPGVLYTYDPYPQDKNEMMEKLLIGAGEMTWKAGPLRKKVGICHGTDGNGYALLKLYKRTNDVKWLDRARAFAMHAIHQKRNNHSLWIGDVGLACFLAACIDLDDRIPGLEYY